MFEYRNIINMGRRRGAFVFWWLFRSVQADYVPLGILTSSTTDIVTGCTGRVGIGGDVMVAALRLSCGAHRIPRGHLPALPPDAP